jgi:CRISPR-associated endonuclease/helicase Cas3
MFQNGSSVPDKSPDEADWAHSPGPRALPGAAGHGLDDHLIAVAHGASAMLPSRLAQMGYLAGLWHDLGKRRLGFQRYIRSAGGFEAHIEGRISDRDKTHSAAGALWAAHHLAARSGGKGKLLSRVLQYVIAGHHAGLDNWEGGVGAGLSMRLASEDAVRELNESMARPTPAAILEPLIDMPDPADLAVSNESLTSSPGRFALNVRMLFSALVDADFLDTEAYFDASSAQARSGAVTPAALQAALHAYLGQLGRSDTPVNRARAEVLAACREKAVLSPGVFSLTVPTGGGKTLSSLAFALDHAVQHGKRRVIYAIPFTSIIEQTADTFRRVFDGLGVDTVLEHHSNAESDPQRETARSRLACENWDAPIVVTTNVQLFESLFSRRTSRCRKLHSLIDSVIVLDEAQLLPVEFLQPVVDLLRYLVQDFGVTVLLCTATQPVLDGAASRDPARGLRRGIGGVTEIVSNVADLYSRLERVRVCLPPSLEVATPWSDVADEVVGHGAVLVIVGRRADARDMFELVAARGRDRNEPPGCWHLSALMCAQHRSDTLAQIRAALVAYRRAVADGTPAHPVRVVSTQLIEAGVDLDFPVVYRAMAGLDSIAQAAGRCNREGLLAEPGVVHVFVPPTQPPPGLLRQARDACKAVWHDLPERPFGLPLINAYFRRLYHDAASLDAKGISEALRLQIDTKALSLSVRFRDAAEAFRLIDDDDAATVLVRYRSAKPGEDIDKLIGMLERDGPARWLMRRLQRYGVSVYRYQLTALVASGDVREIAACPGLYVQADGCDGFYHPVTGAQVDGTPGDPLAYVA